MLRVSVTLRWFTYGILYLWDDIFFVTEINMSHFICRLNKILKYLLLMQYPASVGAFQFIALHE